MKEQNHWLRNTEKEVSDRYQVPTNKGYYTNIIIECDLQALKRFMEKGYVICGLDKKKVFEVVDIMQCFNCQQFGHFQFYQLSQKSKGTLSTEGETGPI